VGLKNLVERKFRVAILEDDAYFMDLLVDVFEKSGKFEVQAKFSNIEELLQGLPNFMSRFSSHPEEFPDLLCLDIFAGPSSEFGLDALNGASISLYLKKADMNIAVLLISSINSANLKSLFTDNFPGFLYLQKTSKITDEEIIKAALQAVMSMGEI
jgi:DNA-binding NarL/FixJ family response regulator